MITFDFETKSHADLKKVGAWSYSEHSTTEVICAAYGIDSNEIQTWWPGKRLVGKQAWPSKVADYAFHRDPRLVEHMPYDLLHALINGDEMEFTSKLYPGPYRGQLIEAHNVAFERSIWMNVMVPEYGWHLPEPWQWRDTMAVAAYYSMPPALEKLANALGYEGKDPEGSRLISKYSKLHLKKASDEIPDEDFDKFVKYCVKDVMIEQTVSDELGELPPREVDVFFMDQEINLRGLHLDEISIRNASFIVEKRGEELANEFKAVTGVNPTQRDKVLEWFEERGVELDNMQADYLEEVIDGAHGHVFDTPELKEARHMLGLRLKYAKASTKKLNAMLRQNGHDHRARYQSKYHGAGTGRWTGTGFQPLNLSKGFEDIDPDQLVKDISYLDPEWLDIIYGDAMDAVGKASRHHIRAQEGSRIIAGDFVSIEAVLLACLAGEHWKIDAFRRKDPIYELMGCKIHNLPQSAIDLAKHDKKAFKEKYGAERFDGKTGELAFGYQGGLGAWRNFDSSDKHSDDRVNEIKDAWREEHPAIKQFWYDLEAAAIEATANPGRVTQVRQIGYEVVDEWLTAILPNGKRVWYRDPQLRKGMPNWHKPDVYDPKDEKTWEYEDCYAGTCDCKPRLQLTYMSQKEGRWLRNQTYGGKLCENVTQATSREVLVPAMMRLRNEGYPIILTVYDEIVTEPKLGFGSVRELEEIMAESPGDWAKDEFGKPWPIGVDAWEGDRYKK